MKFSDLDSSNTLFLFFSTLKVDFLNLALSYLALLSFKSEFCVILEFLSSFNDFIKRLLLFIIVIFLKLLLFIKSCLCFLNELFITSLFISSSLFLSSLFSPSLILKIFSSLIVDSLINFFLIKLILFAIESLFSLFSPKIKF